MCRIYSVFDHVTIRVSDLGQSRRFYGEALGLPTHDGEFVEWDAFSLLEDEDVTRNLHLGFGVEDRDAVDAWWLRMTGAGYEPDGEPGPRPYNDTYYGAFVRDPDGNSVEAMHHARSRLGLDHLWLRTRDVAVERAFYETVAPVVGWHLQHGDPDKIRFGDGDGSFTFVTGDEPTRNVHLAFGVAGFATVQRFHGVALAAGYVDNGEPGERPEYHPGYHGAFVLDPDGHNIEAVYHLRA